MHTTCQLNAPLSYIVHGLIWLLVFCNFPTEPSSSRPRHHLSGRVDLHMQTFNVPENISVEIVGKFWTLWTSRVALLKTGFYKRMKPGWHAKARVLKADFNMYRFNLCIDFSIHFEPNLVSIYQTVAQFVLPDLAQIWFYQTSDTKITSCQRRSYSNGLFCLRIHIYKRIAEKLRFSITVPRLRFECSGRSQSVR